MSAGTTLHLVADMFALHNMLFARMFEFEQGAQGPRRMPELGLQPDPASEHIAATRYVTPWENT